MSNYKIMGKHNKRNLVPARVVIKYILLQVPAFFLLIITIKIIIRVIDIPAWLLWVVISAWIIKDIALFPRVWRAYDSRNPNHRESLIGMNGIVINELNPTGYIKIMGELWKAEIKDNQIPVKKGEMVKVNEINKIRLVVERINNP